jgi:type II secretory pathway pseudopilin PulG
MAVNMRIGKAFPFLAKRFKNQTGFTLLAVLAALLLVALGTQKVMVVVSQQAQRERETELLRVGAAFVSAIGAYYESTPGSVKRWPATLQDLTDDKRFVGLRRHIRQVYDDPVGRTSDWGVVRASDGGIAGIYSLSALAPIRSGAIGLEGFNLPAASRYSDWQFIYQPLSVQPRAQP